MGGFVVIVDFRLKPGAVQEFHALVAANARASVRDEPGCRRFDVVVPEGVGDRVLLYEIYDDAAAFALHLKTPHFAAFDRACGALVAKKTVTQGSLAVEGSA